MIEGEVQAIYDQTAEFFRSVSQDFPAGEYRAYEILYGPPAVAAPVMFIGFQPGGDGAEYVAPSTWDERCVYAHADWPLASRLREIFGAAFLAHCTGMNAIFARCRSVEEYRRVPLSVRRRIGDYCRANCEQLLRLLSPQKLVFIGFGAASALRWSVERSIESDRGRTIVQYGHWGAVPCLAVMHLTGAWLTTEERSAIADHLRAFAGLPALATEGA